MSFHSWQASGKWIILKLLNSFVMIKRNFNDKYEEQCKAAGAKSKYNIVKINILQQEILKSSLIAKSYFSKNITI